MKRILGLALAGAMMFTACGEDRPQTNTNNFDYKTGLATYTHTNDTYGYTEGKNGQSAVSTTIVAAVFDKDGKIIDIKIDEVESKTGFDDKGQLAGYTGGEVISKKELKDDYGMKAASSIGKEWYQQIETLEKWLVGKDVNTIISSAATRMGGMQGGNTYNGNMWDGNMNDGNMWGGTADSDSMWGGNATGAIDGRTGGSDTGMPISASPSPDSATSGSVTNDADNMIEEFADGVGDVVDDITGNTNGSTASPAPNTGWMDSDLKAGVTIDTTYIQKAIEKAYRNRA